MQRARSPPTTTTIPVAVPLAWAGTFATAMVALAGIVQPEE